MRCTKHKLRLDGRHFHQEYNIDTNRVLWLYMVRCERCGGVSVLPVWWVCPEPSERHVKDRTPA